MSITPTGTSDERLTHALRITASQAAGLIGGGASLVYTHAEGDASSGRLRAAAGFASAEEARATAAAIDGFVHAIVDAPEGLEEEPLRQHLAEQLARYKIPRSFEWVHEPLRDDAGKVRRSDLREARLAQATR